MSTVSFSGLASGIDSDSLIKATLDAQRLAYAPLQTNIDDNTRESKALQEFNSKLLTLNDSAKDFLSLAGNGISKLGTSSDKDLVDVAVSDAAPASSTTVTVQQLAKGTTFSFNDRFAALDAPIAPGISGTEAVTFTVGTGSNAQTVTANVTNTTTLAELAAALNTTGAGILSATPVNVGTESAPSYTLVITSNETGVDKGSVSASVSPGLTGAGVFAASTVDQAQDAIFTLAGIGQMTRGSNKISGIIPGVTFNLKQATNLPVQVTVNNDNDKTTARFTTLIGQINDIIKYSRDNSTVTQDTKNNTNVFADLAHTRLDDQAVRDIKDALAGAFSSGGGQVQSFADMGISTNRDGTLAIDSAKFSAALGQDPKGAGDILNQFADKIGATGGVVDNYTRYQGTIATAISSNDDQSKSLQDRIDTIEANLSKQQDMLKKLFADLETKTAELQSQGSALTSLSQSFAANSSTG